MLDRYFPGRREHPMPQFSEEALVELDNVLTYLTQEGRVVQGFLLHDIRQLRYVRVEETEPSRVGQVNGALLASGRGVGIREALVDAKEALKERDRPREHFRHRGNVFPPDPLDAWVQRANSFVCFRGGVGFQIQLFGETTVNKIGGSFRDVLEAAFSASETSIV